MRKLSPSVLKLAGLCLAILGLVAFVKMGLRSPFPPSMSSSIETLHEGELDAVFVGSSRVQASVNPSQFGQFKVVNLGMKSMTILPSLIMVKHLVDSIQPRTIYVELTPLKTEIPEATDDFFNELGIDAIAESRLVLLDYQPIHRWQILSQLLNQKVFASISIRDEIKSALDWEKDGASMAIVGFNPSEKTSEKLPNVRLNIGDSGFYMPLDELSRMLLKSAEYANDKGVELKFFLPLTYEQVAEKNRSLQIFNMLPDEFRIDYDDLILTELNSQNNLRDQNHFNSNGAKIYSEWMGERLNSNSANVTIQ